jgi:hypothetical protein
MQYFRYGAARSIHSSPHLRLLLLPSVAGRLLCSDGARAMPFCLSSTASPGAVCELSPPACISDTD